MRGRSLPGLARARPGALSVPNEEPRNQPARRALPFGEEKPKPQREGVDRVGSIEKQARRQYSAMPPLSNHDG
jgi:hypothetical protein